MGFTEIDALKAVAKQYPDNALRDRRRLERRRRQAEERRGAALQRAGSRLPRRVCGRACSEARRRTTVSSVGGQKQPPVDRYIAGFQAGAKAADPSLKTLNGYSQDSDKQSKCKEIALNQIAAGSVVIFQVAAGCGLGALDGAKEKNVWGIGVDADQGYLGPYVLTSAMKRVDTSVFQAISQTKAGHFRGGTDAVYGLDVGRRRDREVLLEGACGDRREGGDDQAANRLREDHRHPDDGEVAHTPTSKVT